MATNYRLREAIRERMTQRQFAALVGDDETLVSRVVNGIWNLPKERQRVYAKMLGMRPADLFADYEE